MNYTTHSYCYLIEIMKIMVVALVANIQHLVEILKILVVVVVANIQHLVRVSI